MGVEADARGEEMRALAKTRECRGEDPMAVGGQEIGDSAPAPAAVPGAMHQHEGRYGISVGHRISPDFARDDVAKTISPAQCAVEARCMRGRARPLPGAG